MIIDRLMTPETTLLTSSAGPKKNSITLRAPGEEDVLLASGLADRPRREPLTPDCLFRIASCTKTYVAGCLLQLAQEGRLDLIESYCRKDVEITRDLFTYGLTHGHLLFDRKAEGRLRVPVDWNLDKLAQRGQET